MTAPRTAAGRALLNDFLNGSPGSEPTSFGYAGITADDLERGILAIEAEATPDRERLAAVLRTLGYAVGKKAGQTRAAAILAKLREPLP